MALLLLQSLPASLMSSLARTVTEVVPSPTSLSWTLDISTRTLAAGLSTPTDLRIVAPSFVTSTDPLGLPMPQRILSMPLGPRVLLTRSPMAIAPTKEDKRATSAFSSSALFFIILIGFKETILKYYDEFSSQEELTQALLAW